jgi:uncharacterized protein YndB with AHSA1/START domain
MIKKILIGLVLLVGAVLALASFQPDSYTVERRATIAAPPEKIYGLIADFNNWRVWSPWERLDSAMVRTISGAPSGVGAVYEWKGNSKVGEGRMEIKEALAPSRVSVDLRFIEPVPSNSLLTFSITPVTGGTEVIWNMRGESVFVSKIITTFVSMDKMVGGDFDRGMAQLKEAAEKP